MKRTEKEIFAQIDKAMESLENSIYPGMTYEQGVEAALRWALGETESEPMED